MVKALFLFQEFGTSNLSEKILRHCNLWRENIPRQPPSAKPPPEPIGCETLDYGFTSTRLSASFEQNCA
jgi:hypothetical protein